MLEGIEKTAKQSEIIKAAKAYKDSLEVKILKLCKDFEAESGLTVMDLEIYRLNLETLGPGEKGHAIYEVKARVEL